MQFHEDFFDLFDFTSFFAWTFWNFLPRCVYLWLIWWSFLNIAKFFPRQTAHRQTLPSWYTRETSHLLKKLDTQRKLLKAKPTAYRKQKVKKLETEFLEASEQDRIYYQTKISETRNTDLMCKHFKRMSQENSITSTVVLNGQESRTVKETLNLFNEYFQSVYLPKNETLSDILLQRT